MYACTTQELSKEQLSSLGYNQALQVSATQYNALRAEQKNALNSAKEQITNIKDGDNGTVTFKYFIYLSVRQKFYSRTNMYMYLHIN